jgi:hypothetical protein
MRDSIEFYDKDRIVARAHSSIVPAVGSFVNINKTTWVVSKVTYAVDYSDSPHDTAMRANVDLIREQHD